MVHWLALSPRKSVVRIFTDKSISPKGKATVIVYDDLTKQGHMYRTNWGIGHSMKETSLMHIRITIFE